MLSCKWHGRLLLRVEKTWESGCYANRHNGERSMTIIQALQAGTLSAALLLGTAAVAAEGDDNTQLSQPQRKAAKKTPDQERQAQEPGKTSGPADKTDVSPSLGRDAHGGPGTPGMRGNKSGPAATPPK